MRAETFWKTVTADTTGLLDRLIGLLAERGVRYCVVNGLGVNAYADPVVSLDLDLAVALEDLGRIEPLLRERFTVERFPHSINISERGSSLRVQFQTDPRYAAFVPRAALRDVLGVRLPVAHVEDVLQGKIWAVSDTDRRPSKRQKDLADIARLLETLPALRERVPPEILARLL
jgi:hypothetical protein